MPISVRDGTRPRAARMRLYSSAVILCWASSSGVTATGSGTTAEEAVVITIASIVAWQSHRGGFKTCGKRDDDQLAYRSRPNTVHVIILMAFRMLMLASMGACLGRSGKLPILRLTPRGLRRFRLDTTRSGRISSRTALWNFFCRGGNSSIEVQLAPDHAYGMEEGEPIGIFEI